MDLHPSLITDSETRSIYKQSYLKRIMKRIKNLLMIVAVLFGVTGCSVYSSTPIQYQSLPVIADQGRVVFSKIEYVGGYGVSGTKEIVSALFIGGPRDLNQTYHLYEVKEDDFIPLTEFKMPSGRNTNPKEVFFTDLPVGKHRFIIVRSKVDFFIEHFIGSVAIIDVDIVSGQTHPILFGPGDWFGKSLLPEIKILNYPLAKEDIEQCYALRQKNISDVERNDSLTALEENLFANGEGALPYRSAMQATTFMKKMVTSDSFVEWTVKNKDDIRADYLEVSPESIVHKPLEVYKYAQKESVPPKATL